MPHHQNTLSAVTIQTKFLKIFVHCQVINSLACAIFLCHLVFSSTNIYIYTGMVLDCYIVTVPYLFGNDSLGINTAISCKWFKNETLLQHLCL